MQESPSRHHDSGTSWDRVWCSYPWPVLCLPPPLTVLPHPVHPLRHLAVAVHAAPWPVTRGEAVDLAFVTGFRREQLLVWAVLGSRAEAQAGDAVPKPGRGARGVADLQGKDSRTSPATLTFHWSHAACGRKHCYANVPLWLCMHLPGTCICVCTCILGLPGQWCEPACMQECMNVPECTQGLCTCKPACTLGCGCVRVEIDECTRVPRHVGTV